MATTAFSFPLCIRAGGGGGEGPSSSLATSPLKVGAAASLSVLHRLPDLQSPGWWLVGEQAGRRDYEVPSKHGTAPGATLGGRLGHQRAGKSNHGVRSGKEMENVCQGSRKAQTVCSKPVLLVHSQPNIPTPVSLAKGLSQATSSCKPRWC